MVFAVGFKQKIEDQAGGDAAAEKVSQGGEDSGHRGQQDCAYEESQIVLQEHHWQAAPDQDQDVYKRQVGRCGHICNASYAVEKEIRGQHIGEKLVIHCLGKAKDLGFRILQFNAVVKSNKSALHLYEKLGFVKLGTIPGGFLMKDGTYEDIIPHYHVL